LAAWAQGPAWAADVAAPPPPPVWAHALNLRAVAGYKDNVLLSSFAPEASAFLGAGAELVVSRAFGENTLFESFLTLEDRHYLTADSVEDEQLVFALGQLKQEGRAGWRGSLTGEYLYQDQILDVSVTEAELTTARVQGHTVDLRAGLGRDFGAHSLELLVTGERDLYRAPLDDYWQTGPKLLWTWLPRVRTDFTASYEFFHRWYDTEEERTADGTTVPGTQRTADNHQLELAWRQYWDDPRRWRSTAKLSGRLSQDGGSGYFDYRRAQASLALRYRDRPWEWEAGAKLAHYEYPVQTVSDTDPTHRRRTEIEFTLRGERRILQFLSLVAEYSFEQNLANRASEEYSVNTVSGGLNFEF
jgi:hypothetical protein